MIDSYRGGSMSLPFRLYMGIVLLWSLAAATGMTIRKDRLVDMPVSNHGARIRLILHRYSFTQIVIYMQIIFNSYTH